MRNPDEKARAWTRLQDYWPSRGPARASRRRARGYRPGSDLGDPLDAPRPLLGILPFALLMLSLGVMAIAIFIAAWPGRRPVDPPRPAAVAEPGTAPKGWIDGR